MIGKKNVQSSVSDAKWEILTLGSTDNAGHSVISFPALSVYHRVGISLSVSGTDDRFYLSISCLYILVKLTIIVPRLVVQVLALHTFKISVIIFKLKYSRTSIARTLMARLPWLFRTRS